jgi:DNA repair ATPase RecN
LIPLAYNEGVCNQIHKAVDEKLNLHEKRLNSHSERLDTIEQDGREYKVQISNLCTQVANLVNTIKWLIGLSVPAILTIIGLLLRK